MTTSIAAHSQWTHTGNPARDPADVLATSTFSVGLGLLPRRLQRDGKRLYELLRTLDDLVDECHPAAESRVAAVERWATGRPAGTPEALTLDDLAGRYPLDRDAFLDFCEGMRHDIARATIETEVELDVYCHRVGGTVGTMLSALLGTANAEGERRMEQLGRAMQLTNILRDIDEDHENGRCYIPLALVERFGPPHPGQREQLLREQIRRADALFEEGLAAIPLLRSGKRAMELSTLLYREILRQIEREGFGRDAGRAQVPAWRKRQLIAQTRSRASTLSRREISMT